MERKFYKLETYKKNDGKFVLLESQRPTTKDAGINAFKKCMEECYLDEKDIEKVDGRDGFIWRIKTDKYLLILRKEF